jgi:hypothetical protein
MSQLVDRLHETITVERSQFMLRDQDGTLDEPPGWPSVEEVSARLSQGSWFEATLNWAVFLSSDGWHETQVVLELWDDSPPDATGSWERSKVAPFYSSSGLVYLSRLYGSGPPPVPLDLRRDADEWNIRASRRPGGGWSWPEEDCPPQGVEEWCIQFWPLRGLVADLTDASRRTADSPSVQRYLETLSRIGT